MGTMVEAYKQLEEADQAGQDDPRPMPRMKALLAEPGFFPNQEGPAKATGSPRVQRKPSGVTNAERTALWTALEAQMAGLGLKDSDISVSLGIAAANLVQWRKAGMVSGTKAQAVKELLATRA
jgi:hypothetical protein